MNKRDITLDWFKVLLSVFVVCIHMPSLFGKDSTLSWYFGAEGIPTIAVPIFFIINGYFFFRILDNKLKARQYFFRILMMHILWSTIYVPIYYNMAPLKYVIIFMITGYYHLWYLPALLFGSILLYLVNKRTKNTAITLLISFMIYIAFQFGKMYNIEVKTIGLIYFFLSNVSIGFLFISLGTYLNSKYKLEQINKKKLAYIAIAGFILFAILIYPDLEYVYKQLIRNSIFLPILCPILFMMAMKLSTYKEITGYKKYLSNISTGIYFTHLYLVLKYYPFMKEDYNIVNLPIIIFICVTLTVGLIIVNKKVKYLL